MRKIISLMLVIVLIISSSIFAAAQAGPEENVEEQTNKAGIFLQESGILKGDNGDLMLDKKLKRQDMVVLLSRLMGAKNIEGLSKVINLSFKDISDSNYTDYLAWGVANKLIEGHSPERFGFNENITAQQFSAIILRVLGYEIEYDKSLETAKGFGILNGAEVESSTEITRGEMSVITLNALKTFIKDSEITLGQKLGIEVPVETPQKFEVVSVNTDNLKEISVVFSEKVDRESAAMLTNYSFDFEFEYAELSEDGKTVVLTLKDDEKSVMEAQKNYKLIINKVENENKTAKLESTEIPFTATDSTIPAVKEVRGLGTKAVQVIFSEPIKRKPASLASSYKIDGNTVSGSVKYEYPDTVIISADLTEGDHKISVSGVEDFYNFSMEKVEMNFTAAEDEDAPEIVSVNFLDLNKAVVEFNEPIKSVKDGYYDSKSNPAKNPIKINCNKIILEFKGKIEFGSATLYIDGIEDYSGNKTDRSTVVDLKPNIISPEVVSVKVEDGRSFTIVFNKDVNSSQAERGTNYTIAWANGNKINGNGLSNGNPVVPMKYSNRKVTFSLPKIMSYGEYKIQINGIQDTSYLKNDMVPYDGNFVVEDLGSPIIDKAFISNERENVETGEGKIGTYLYIQFSNDMNTDGENSILDINNYSYSMNAEFDKDGKFKSADWKEFPERTDVDLFDFKTVRIKVPEEEKGGIKAVRVISVKNRVGNYIKDFVAVRKIEDKMDAVHFVAKAIDEDTIQVDFTGIKLSVIDENDFFVRVNGEDISIVLESTEAEGSVGIFKITGGHKIPPNVKGYEFWSKPDVRSQTAFGEKVSANSSTKLEDDIAPTVEKYGNGRECIVVDGNKVEITFDEPIKVNYGNTNIVKVGCEGWGNDEFVVKEIKSVREKLLIILNKAIEPKDELNIITVTINSANQTTKDITDESTMTMPVGRGPNAVSGQTLYIPYKDATRGKISVNKNKLAEIIKEGEEKEEGDYTEETWANFQSALESAREVYNDENSTEEEVEETVSSLRQSIDGLMTKDQAAANSVIEKINSLPSAEGLTLGDKDAVLACKEAYNNLTSTQKSLIPSDVLSKFLDILGKLDELEDGSGQDSEEGIEKNQQEETTQQ